MLIQRNKEFKTSCFFSLVYIYVINQVLFIIKILEKFSFPYIIIVHTPYIPFTYSIKLIVKAFKHKTHAKLFYLEFNVTKLTFLIVYLIFVCGRTVSLPDPHKKCIRDWPTCIWWSGLVCVGVCVCGCVCSAFVFNSLTPESVEAKWSC